MAKFCYRGPDVQDSIGIAALIAASLFVSNVSAATIEEVRVDPGTMEPECAIVAGEHPASIQAATLYATVEDISIVDPPVDKAYQSFDCGGEMSTIYYYEYASESDLKRNLPFFEAVIWGGSGPSKSHPELIIPAGNVLVIISASKPKPFKKYLGRPS